MAVARWNVLNRRYHSGILAWGLGHDRSRTALPYTNVASWIETPTVRRRSSHPGVIPSTTRWNLLPAWSVQTSARRCYSGSNMDLAQRLARKGNTALYKKRCGLTGLTVSPANVEDLESVLGLWQSEGFDGDLEQLWELQRHLCPDTFLCAKINGRFAGAVATVMLTERLAIQCALIVAPEFRGQGLGRHLIREGRYLADFRCNIVADATEEMAGPYRAWDWDVQTYILRDYTGIIQRDGLLAHIGHPSPQDFTVTPIQDVDPDMIWEYDRKIHPMSENRYKYLESYFKRNECHAVVAMPKDTRRVGTVLGYGAMCGIGEGYYLGPVYAEDEGVAVKLLSALIGHLPASAKVRMYIPDANVQARHLVEVMGLTPESAAIRVHDLEPVEMNMQSIFGCSYASHLGFLMC